MSETPDELRARLAVLAAAATDRPWEADGSEINKLDRTQWIGETCNIDDPAATDANAAFMVALVNAWPTIDALLARLAELEGVSSDNARLNQALHDMSMALAIAEARLTAVARGEQP